MLSCAAGLYLFVLKRMQLAESIQIKVALYFTLFCGVGFALFLPFRCITTLMGPTLFGYHGRTYIQTYLVTYMLSGLRDFVVGQCMAIITGRIARSASCRY